MYHYNRERDQLPPEAKEKLPLLEMLEFIRTEQLVILSSSSGSGKTHIAISLGLKARIQIL